MKRTKNQERLGMTIIDKLDISQDWDLGKLPLLGELASRLRRLSTRFGSLWNHWQIRYGKNLENDWPAELGVYKKNFINSQNAATWCGANPVEHRRCTWPGCVQDQGQSCWGFLIGSNMLQGIISIWCSHMSHQWMYQLSNCRLVACEDRQPGHFALSTRICLCSNMHCLHGRYSGGALGNPTSFMDPMDLFLPLPKQNQKSKVATELIVFDFAMPKAGPGCASHGKEWLEKQEEYDVDGKTATFAKIWQLVN